MVMMPMLHMSEAFVALPRHASGAIYTGVPVTSELFAFFDRVAAAPKSVNLQFPSIIRSTLCGLMSL